jgi:hypothetical protein
MGHLSVGGSDAVHRLCRCVKSLAEMQNCLPAGIANP